MEAYQQAEALMQNGRPASLMEVIIPLPMAITAAGYVEKYGPEERYNYLRFIQSVRCPILLTLGAIEAAQNVAFRGAAEALAEGRQRSLTVKTIPNADHFYSQARDALLAQVDEWLLSKSVFGS